MTRKLAGFLLGALLAFACVDFLVQYQLRHLHRSEEKLSVASELSTLRADLEKEVTANLLLVQGTANFISVTPDVSKETFENYAQRVLERSDLLKNLGAAPDYIMTYVYPVEGNEAIIGMNYRDLPNQWELVQMVALTGDLVVAGPIKLAQGGNGLIGRAPVYIYRNNSKKFWGIVSSVINIDRLYEKVGIDNKKLDIAIRGTDGRGEDGGIFKGRPELFEPYENAVMMPVRFPAGYWILAGKPLAGWAEFHPLAPWVHSLFALMAVGTGIFLYRSYNHNTQIDLVRKNLNISQAIAHLGSWEFNHHTERLWWSDEVYRIFGLVPEETTPSEEFFVSLVHPGDQQKVREEIERSRNGCGGFAVDHRIVRNDGSLRYLQERGNVQCDSKGNPVVSRGTVLDITERVLAEEASRAKAEQLRAMSEASHDALVMIDSDDRIMFWSQAAEKMFGWDSDEALGQKLHQLIAPKKDREQAWQGLKHFSKSGQGPVVGSVSEFMALRRDGSLIPVERSVSSFALGDRYYAVGTLRDISERKKAEQELRAYSDRLTLASQAGQIGVWEWSLKDDTIVWDEQMFKLYAVGQHEFSGLLEAWRSRLHPDDRAEAELSLSKAAENEQTWESEFRIIWPDGEIRYIKAAALIRRNENGDSVYMTGVNWDVTESRRNQEKLRLLATTDSMTGLYNRRYFMELAEREIDRSRRYNGPFSFIMLDVDKFKAVNDTYGHDVGDIVLKTLVDVVKSGIRDVDIFGRIGGEEFAIGLPQTDLQAGSQVAEKIRALIEVAEATLPDGRTIGFTASLGLAEYSDAFGTLEKLIKAADKALYRAKQNGRNRVEITSADPDEETSG